MFVMRPNWSDCPNQCHESYRTWLTSRIDLSPARRATRSVRVVVGPLAASVLAALAAPKQIAESVVFEPAAATALRRTHKHSPCVGLTDGQTNAHRVMAHRAHRRAHWRFGAARTLCALSLNCSPARRRNAAGSARGSVRRLCLRLSRCALKSSQKSRSQRAAAVFGAINSGQRQTDRRTDGQAGRHIQ